MKPVRDLKQILQDHERDGLQQNMQETIPEEVLERLVLRPKDLKKEVTVLEQQLGLTFHEDLRHLLQNYDLTSTSILALDFHLSLADLFDQHHHFIQSLGLLPLGSDPPENHYHLNLSDQSLHVHGPEMDPEQHWRVSNSLISWLQVFDAYDWEGFPQLPASEYEAICGFVGANPENPYWSQLYKLGEPIL